MNKIKKSEYPEVSLSEEAEKKEPLEKSEETALPQFVKEVPLKVRKRDNGQTITIEYEWGPFDGGNVKISEIEYIKGEQLNNLYRLPIVDGTDTFTLRHGQSIYILRKTTKTVAVALLNVCRRLKGIVETVVGWMRTVLGDVYYISKINKGSWAFDKNLTANLEIQMLSVENLARRQKQRLCELIIEQTVALHKQNLVLRNFSLSNVILNDTGLLFSDARNLRLVKRCSVLAEEFRKMLRNLVSAGLLSVEDIYHSIAVYSAAMEESCSKWYIEKKGRVGDQFEIALEMERSVYS